MKILCDIVGSTFLSIAIIYSMLKILKYPIGRENYKKCIASIVLLSIYLIISYYSTMLFLRYLLFIFVTTFITNIFLKGSFKKIFVSSFFTFILIVLSIFKLDTTTFHGMLLGNLGIATIMICLIKIPPILNFVQKALEKISKFKKFYSIAIIVILSLAASIIVYINYFPISSVVRFLLSLTIVIIYTAITIMLFNEKNNSNKIQYEYENVLKNLEEYEKMLDYQKVATHENKNQL